MKPKKKHIVAISGILAVSAYIMKELSGYAPLTVTLMLAATAAAGAPIFKKALGGLRYRIIGIDLLVTIAVAGAILVGEYWEAAAVTFLFTLGEYLESRTIEKTRSSIRSLMNLAPDRARVRRGDTEELVSPEEVAAGDLVIVKPGEKIPVDGTVLEGEAYVNQAAITGESIPVSRSADGKVFSGTVIESGYLLIKADRVGEDTTFARILHMVEEAQDKKARTQKFLERFSKYYTPGIILLSAFVYFITRDIRLALTLLVISCPGALVISTPISIVAGIGNGARSGVLFKGGDIIEKLGTVKAVAFDKTGTLTQGRPGVAHVQTFGMDETQFLRLAAIGESYSEHPIGKAIIREAQERTHRPIPPPESARMIVGRGLAFTQGGREYFLGSRRLFDDAGIDISRHEEALRREEEQGRTAVLLGTKEGICGIVSIADALREDAAPLVEDLRRQGVRHITMLTGDNRKAAASAAASAGLDSFYAELLPEDKVRVLAQLKDEFATVLMVGDGINDAPALASADLGIAVGGAGADVAMETADAVLMSADIHKLSYAVGLSRATVNNIRQNIGFALLVVALLLAGVLFSAVNMSLGMLVHEGSVLLVTLNAIRLLGYGKRQRRKKNAQLSTLSESRPVHRSCPDF